MPQRTSTGKRGGAMVQTSLVIRWYKKRYPGRRVSMRTVAEAVGHAAKHILQQASEEAKKRGAPAIEPSDVKPLEMLGRGKQVVLSRSARFHVAKARFARVVRSSIPPGGKRLTPCATQVLQLVAEDLLRTLARGAAAVKGNTRLTPEAVRAAAEISRSPLALPAPRPVVNASGLTTALATTRRRPAGGQVKKARTGGFGYAGSG
ncbi:hypothetical protein DIPPA_15111 [Diplonema papillatum]|nr:hypothetical protein DIPPA_15111 [Diplonema papillatum]